MKEYKENINQQYIWRRKKHSVLGRPNLHWQRDIHLHAKIPEALRCGSWTEKSTSNTNKNLRILDIQGRAKNKWAENRSSQGAGMKESQAWTRERDWNEKVACSTKYWVRPLVWWLRRPLKLWRCLNASGIFACRCISFCHWRFGLPKTECFSLLYIHKFLAKFWSHQTTSMEGINGF